MRIAIVLTIPLLSGSGLISLPAVAQETPEAPAQAPTTERPVITKQFGDGQVYQGEFENGKPNGKGRYSFRNGAVYEGEFVDGKFQGQGVMTYADGGRYEGEFKGDRFNGQGVQTWKSGARYEGSFLNGQFHGQGTYTWSNGSSYEGEFRQGKAEGKGTKTQTNGATLAGNWRNWNLHGYGVLAFPTGEKYEGEYQDGKRTGRGIYTWPNGASYEGEFLDGKLHGNGAYKAPDGMRREGAWQNDKLHGKGLEMWPSAGRYEGDFDTGRRHGFGKYSFPKGGAYEGQWIDNVRQGFAIVQYGTGMVVANVYHKDAPLASSQRDLRQLNDKPSGCGGDFAGWAIYEGVCTPSGLQISPKTRIIALVNKETFDDYLHAPGGNDELVMYQQGVRIVGKTNGLFNFTEAKVQRAADLSGGNAADRSNTDFADRRSGNGKSEWRTIYIGPMQGLSMQGTGRCARDDGNFEPCTMNNGQRVQ